MPKKVKPNTGVDVDVQKLSKEPSSNSRKFHAACQEINEKNQKYFSTHQVDFEDEESSEGDEEQENNVLGKVIANYENQDDKEELQHRLQDAFRTGGLICLVCIDNIKRTDEIWSCDNCCCAFHLGCIQKWAKNSIFKRAQEQDEALSWNNPMSRTQRMSLEWCCPNCRLEYPQTSIPSVYKCFCQKKTNPEFDPWLIPHSCGEECHKKLKPECGHKCRLLCHPGKCAPCACMVSLCCHCGNGKKVKRCSNKLWSCHQPCGRVLSCKQHQCKELCHPGQCEPCPKLSLQKCMCRSSTHKRLCAEPQWQCDKVCKKMFACGHHSCEKVCHSGGCGDCPLSGERSCPCGKTLHHVPCTEAIPSCGDTCDKKLTCGLHYCMARCHKGECPTCLQYLNKSCHCGSREKEMACSKDFTCDLKCKQVRDCKRHTCNKKCCLGNCPPCDQPCNKMLTCKNHKCESRCHQGPCFPCRLTHTLSCACGHTCVTVPCGREKTAPKPKCFLNCKRNAKCHHPFQVKHKCHTGDCPTCQKICNEVLACSHKCAATCHDVVPVKVAASQKRAGPWERLSGPVIETRKLDHPKCKVEVPITCLGGHETVGFGCFEAKPYPCLEACGRRLRCTNHTCQQRCHTVEGGGKDTSKAGKNCATCSDACKKPRPDGCTHVCMRECHPGPCPPCIQSSKMTCHCGLLQVVVGCQQWVAADDLTKRKLKSCINNCSQTISCGHKCQKLCHTGACTLPAECHKKVTLKCACKRIRQEVICSSGRKANSPLCDDICHRILEQKKQAEEVIKLKEHEDKERKRKQLLEEKKQAEQNQNLRRRKKPVKLVVEEPSDDGEMWWQSKFVLVSSIIFIIIIALLCST